MGICETRKGSGLSIFYPNPVDQVLYIDLDKFLNAQNKSAITYEVRLYDSQGNLVQQAKAKSGIVEFDVSSLADGVYFIYLYDGVSVIPEVHKVIVQH